MGKPAVHMGALLSCSFGLAPATLNVLPVRRVMIEGTPAATIEDSEIVNVPTFGMCSSLANPEVAAATAAALGVLTPMPCVPVLTPWVPGSPTTLIGGAPALVSGSQCVCGYGGVVQISFPGSTRTME
ncbi:MAG TPA: DUF4280 domain-containing protein [Acidimicrobiales bacterium]|nr:DUF4280 domain-containing protein [Acidimicrobiales bacterium]